MKSTWVAEHLAERGSSKHTDQLNSDSGGQRPFTVVLTGGVASGKSTASRYFEKLGVTVVDTDIIAHEIVEPGKPALSKIAKLFGNTILLPDGSLDRRELRKRIFAERKERRRLETILHPLIREEVSRRLQAVRGPYCILVIPLYDSDSGYESVDRVLVIDAKVETQIERLLSRDDIEPELAKAMIGVQISRDDRLLLADDIIKNEFDMEKLGARIEQLHQKYCDEAALKHRVTLDQAE